VSAATIRRLRAALQDRYEALVRCSCSEQPFEVPSSVQRYFINPYAFEYVQAIRRFVAGARRVLIIGDGGGRDYYSLSLLGKQPVVMDIAVQSVVPAMVLADANAPLPFAPETFDAVVMAEVIEHLPNDCQALREIHKILKDDGALVLTVPYFHDAEPTHVRIHSPASIERLLRASGWRITGYIEKGGGLCRLIEWVPFRAIIHMCNGLLWLMRGKTGYQPLYRKVAAIDFWLERKRNSLHRWWKLWSAFIRCSKGESTDWSLLNRNAFENMHACSHDGGGCANGGGGPVKILVVGPQFPDSFAWNVSVTLGAMGFSVATLTPGLLSGRQDRAYNTLLSLGVRFSPALEQRSQDQR